MTSDYNLDAHFVPIFARPLTCVHECVRAISSASFVTPSNLPLFPHDGLPQCLSPHGRSYAFIATSSGIVAVKRKVSSELQLVGNDEQYVVLSHGFGSDQSVWKYVLPYLVNDFKVILYDLKGAGTTNPDDFKFSRYSFLHAYADDLLAILDELEIERCVFVGASVLGMIGCLASIERPDVFKKLILLAPSPRYLNDVGYFGGFDQKDLDQLYGDMKSNFKSWVAGFGPLAVGSNLESCAVQNSAGHSTQCDPTSRSACAKLYLRAIYLSQCHW